MPTVIVPANFKKVARAKERRLREAIALCVAQLGKDPKHPGLQVHRVQGAKGVWEAYVDRANRITFERDGDTIILRNNCNHDILDRKP